MSTLRLAIEGMHCGGCVRRVTAVLEKLPGVTVKQVAVGSALLAVGPGVGADAVVTSLYRAGFTTTAEVTDDRC